jgi:hypothetical protein
MAPQIVEPHQAASHIAPVEGLFWLFDGYFMIGQIDMQNLAGESV